MKIKTNLRAGSGGSSSSISTGATGGTSTSRHTGVDPTPPPPVYTRCAGY